MICGTGDDMSDFGSCAPASALMKPVIWAGFTSPGGIVFGGLLAAFGPEVSLTIGVVGTGVVTVAIWLFSSVTRNYTLDQ